MMLTDLPQEIIMYGVTRYATIEELPKLTLVNKSFHAIANNILSSNIIDGVILNRIDNNIHLFMQRYNITYKDIIASSIHSTIFDKFIVLAGLPVEKQIDYMDMMFNFTIASKRSLLNFTEKNKKKDYSRLHTQTDIFEYTTKSNEQIDFTIFQFLLYLVSHFMQGQAQLLMKLCILKQMTAYFECHMLNSIQSMCCDNAYNMLYRMSKKSINSYNSQFIQILIDSSIEDVDINIYNIYYIFQTSMLTKRYRKYMPVSLYSGMNHSLCDKVIVTSIYKLNSSFNTQIHTLQFLTLLTGDLNCKNIKFHVIIMIYAYIHDVLQNNLISPAIKMHSSNLKLFNTMYSRSNSLTEQIMNTDKYDETIVAIGVSVLENASKSLEEYLR